MHRRTWGLWAAWACTASTLSAASGQTFVAIGPAPVSAFGGASGRVAGIACSPTDANRFFLATADGGVWKTTTGGSSWTPLTDSLPTTATGAIAIDPSNENILYVGSGEANFANHSRYGLGVYKSIDGGNTWRVLARETFAGRCFSRIVVHPTQGNIVYAAIASAGGGPERFGAKGHPQREGPFGVFKSIDGGETWMLLSGGLPAVDATDLRMDPVDPAALYAGIAQVYGATENGIYKSINAGATWTRLAGGLPVGTGGRVSLDVSPANRNRLYAYFANPAIGIGVGGSAAGGGDQLGAFRSDDGGATWTALAALPAIMSVQGFYNDLVIAHPTNQDIAFFGGVNLRRTDNAGATFTGNLPEHHPDNHAAAFDASGRLIIGNDGGICRSDNLGASFTPLNVGLGNMQLYAGLSTHPTNDAMIFAGLQDNGTARRDTASLTWASVLGGDGGWTQVNQSNPLLVYAQFQGAGNLFRSTNGGLNFGSVGTGLTGRHAFMPPYLIDPNNPNRMLWPNERIFESLDGGSTFAPISADVTTGSPYAIRTMAIARADSRRVYVATSDSRVLVSSDSGRTFVLKLSDALGWPRVTHEIVVSDADPLTVYLAGARFGQPHVRRSRDGGDTWETLDGDLPDVPVNVIAVDERYAQPRLYAGADDGVYVSRNGGGNWTRLGEGIPRTAVIDLKLEPTRPTVSGMRGGRLLVATQGRGMWLGQVYCVADFNRDGNIDADDLGDFITCYFAHPACDEVDFNVDGETNADDLGDFITAFFSGGC